MFNISFSNLKQLQLFCSLLLQQFVKYTVSWLILIVLYILFGLCFVVIISLMLICLFICVLDLVHTQGGGCVKFRFGYQFDVPHSV